MMKGRRAGFQAKTHWLSRVLAVHWSALDLSRALPYLSGGTPWGPCDWQAPGAGRHGDSLVSAL